MSIADINLQNAPQDVLQKAIMGQVPGILPYQALSRLQESMQAKQMQAAQLGQQAQQQQAQLQQQAPVAQQLLQQSGVLDQGISQLQQQVETQDTALKLIPQIVQRAIQQKQGQGQEPRQFSGGGGVTPYSGIMYGNGHARSAPFGSVDMGAPLYDEIPMYDDAPTQFSKVMLDPGAAQVVEGPNSSSPKTDSISGSSRTSSSTRGKPNTSAVDPASSALDAEITAARKKLQGLQAPELLTYEQMQALALKKGEEGSKEYDAAMQKYKDYNAARLAEVSGRDPTEGSFTAGMAALAAKGTDSRRLGSGLATLLGGSQQHTEQQRDKNEEKKDKLMQAQQAMEQARLAYKDGRTDVAQKWMEKAEALKIEAYRWNVGEQRNELNDLKAQQDQRQRIMLEREKMRSAESIAASQREAMVAAAGVRSGAGEDAKTNELRRKYAVDAQRAWEKEEMPNYKDKFTMKMGKEGRILTPEEIADRKQKFIADYVNQRLSLPGAIEPSYTPSAPSAQVPSKGNVTFSWDKIQ